MRIPIAIAFTLATSVTALAQTAETAFQGLSALELTRGELVQTDCTIESLYDGRIYCFSSAEAKVEFELDIKGNIAKAAKEHRSLRR